MKNKPTLSLLGIVIPDAVKTSPILLPSIVFFASSSSRLDPIQHKISSTVEYSSAKEKFKILFDRLTTFRGGMMLDVVCVSDKKCPYVSLLVPKLFMNVKQLVTSRSYSHAR